MHNNDLDLRYLCSMSESTSRSFLWESRSSSAQLPTTFLSIVESDKAFLNSSRLLCTSLSSGERSLRLISLAILAVLRDLTLIPIRSILATAIFSKKTRKLVVCFCRRYFARNLFMSSAKLSTTPRARICCSFLLVSRLIIMFNERDSLLI